MLRHWHEIYVRALASWQPPEPNPPSESSGVRHPQSGAPQGPPAAIALDEPPPNRDVDAVDPPSRDH